MKCINYSKDTNFHRLLKKKYIICIGVCLLRNQNSLLKTFPKETLRSDGFIGKISSTPKEEIKPIIHKHLQKIEEK